MKRPRTDTVRGAAPPADAAVPRLRRTASLRMRDLMRESGLPRETIHFYKLQGLLPEPVKTGPQHRALHARPSRAPAPHPRTAGAAVPAAQGDPRDPGRHREEDFTPEQEDLVRRVRATLTGWTTRPAAADGARRDFVPARVTRRELRELADAGLLACTAAAAAAGSPRTTR